MAQQFTRVEKAAPIFQRVSGLIRAGQLKWEDRPLWFDIYVLCPPVTEPVWNVEMPKKNECVRKLLYPEDNIRAKFYKTYGSPGIINLHSGSKTKTISQTFIETYQRLQSERSELSEDQLFEETSKILIEDGIKLRKRTPRN
ncbi:unnamed protein product [Bursaphelenchus xylophilus]|uniref:Small ribosomal subunit protein mS23 n=1 Tax=Bursaphelenchus xylophilus TaxID=6326 RepID=A0A1I7RNF7_BURXY|nr:unnamed protein product [Bursaphelenchus xylophilus]CAG9123966.1 unnamed protein product [Bursaphelenchus xylophilus]